MVEDIPTNRMLMGIILDELGLTYETANDGVEAVQHFKPARFDAILMDENMPNMNGIETTRHIRELEQEQQRPPTPIIAVTANALKEDRERFLSAGMDDYVSKPCSPQDIQNVLTTFLR